MFDRAPVAIKLDGSRSRWVLIEPFTFEVDGKVMTVPSGFTTDYASIPRVLQWVFNPTDFESSALAHDYMWARNRLGGGPDPVDSDKFFRWALKEERCPWVLRWFAWAAVRAAAIVSGRPGRWSILRSVLFMVWPLGLVAMVVIGVLALVLG